MIIRIATIAVALSIAIMIISMSLIGGFKFQIKEKIFGFWGHIHISNINSLKSYTPTPIAWESKFYNDIKITESISYEKNKTILGFSTNSNETVQTKGGVQHIQAFVTKPGIIKTKDAIEGIIFKGIGKDFDWRFLDQYWQKGKPLTLKDTTISRGIVISQQTADRLKLELGQKFIIYFVENGEQIKRVFDVTGVYKTGLEEYDKKIALIDIRILQQIMGWKPDQVAGYEVYLNDISDLTPMTEHIYQNILDNTLTAETIREKFPSIFDWIELQDVNGYVILGLMLLVGIINMITALLILILERTNMIGILKSMGQSNWDIRKIFLYHASIIAAKGLIWGNIIGISLCYLQLYFSFIKLSEADYYLSYAPILMNWSGILFLNILTLFIIFLALIIPSVLVSRISPIKAIRFK